MPHAIFRFPEGFLWGSATAAHQVEGQNTNNSWAAWENEPGRILNGHKASLACDWWGGRWREDFDRAATAGQNAHRMSVEWSRIQPAPDRWDEDALDRYREMVRGLVQRKMTPLVTLHHFTDPLWLVERGGWENDETPQWFAAFARRVVEALKEYVTLWVTINEPNVYFLSGYVQPNFPPGKNDLNAAMHVTANMVRGHALAYRAIHAAQPTARVGTAINYRSFRPARPGFSLDAIPAKVQHQMFNNSFAQACATGTLNMVIKRFLIPEAANTQDFIGVNYYTEDEVRFDLRNAAAGFGRNAFRASADLSPTGFIDNVPEGMFKALRWASRFHLPMMVTENGVEDNDDRLRPRYLLQHVHQVWRGLNWGWPIKGYFHWSLVDNFEWERGWTQRFGLWGLDVETQTRIRRRSVDLYAAICRENAISHEMVEQYAPEIYAKIYPE